MTKIAIIGYGQMGQLIEKLALENNCQVVTIIDPKLDSEISEESLANVDVCINFTVPDVVLTNIDKISQLKKNIVLGTTGWSDKKEIIRKIVLKNDIGLIYASNFSLGMNLFFSIIDNSTKLMNQVSEYDIWGLEMHHNKKIDSPSGTAKILSEIVIKNTQNKSHAQYDRLNRKIKQQELHFGSIRAGNIPGTHLIGFDSVADTIEIKHIARNREGLAIGALKAANWIKGKKGIYDFKKVFSEIINKG
ncbi:MAG: 4-hydroxy-tetrahydrodipicolinate reductase [Candidatus Cloacimonetes bacterium]|jgi:4-hydroxy-tetrahydrodipicolinate reductase|nr:4-hydroxy-tetrahydrodipicolinate reductase [Candidatus Cloacimonadota bacterium]